MKENIYIIMIKLKILTQVIIPLAAFTFAVVFTGACSSSLESSELEDSCFFFCAAIC